MTLHLRIYPSEQSATAVGARLAASQFGHRTVFLASEHQGREAVTVQQAIDAGQLPERKMQICVSSLKEGRSLVSVEVAFGLGKPALEILDSAETVDSDKIDRYIPNDAAPLSELLCIPVLSDYTPSSSLLGSDWNLSSKFGMGLLSKSQTPRASRFGMKTLSTPKKMEKSFGFSLLSSNAAPLSSLLGMKTIKSEKRGKHGSFGLPYLSENPAPLSSLLGMKTLTDRASND